MTRLETEKRLTGDHTLIGVGSGSAVGDTLVRGSETT